MSVLPEWIPAGPSRRRSFRLLGLVGALAVLGAPASAPAQTADADPPQVEMYVGLRRIDAGSQPRPKPANPGAATSAAPAPQMAPAAPPPPPVEILAPPASAPPARLPASVLSGAVLPAIEVTPDVGSCLPREPLPSSSAGGAGTASARIPSPRPAAPDEAPQAPPPAPPAVHDGPAPASSWLWPAAAQFLGTLAALIAGLTLYRIALLLVGGRRRAAEVPAVRVELVQAPMPVPTPAAKPEAAPEPPAAAAPADAPPEPQPEETLISEAEKSFDLGPSYEDEQREAEEARRRAEHATLRQVFEQNLALRRRLAEGAPAA